MSNGKCTCGATKSNLPGHSDWCDSLIGEPTMKINLLGRPKNPPIGTPIILPSHPLGRPLTQAAPLDFSPPEIDKWFQDWQDKNVKFSASMNDIQIDWFSWRIFVQHYWELYEAYKDALRAVSKEFSGVGKLRGCDTPKVSKTELALQLWETGLLSDKDINSFLDVAEYEKR